MSDGARRRAVIPINEGHLAQMLKLPDGMRVIGVQSEFQTLSVLVMVESPDLPEVGPGEYPKVLPSSIEWDAENRVLRYLPPKVTESTDHE